MARDSFGSRFGALVAMAGSAVGLGNLWRFPYLVGENGGAAFIIIYVAFRYQCQQDMIAYFNSFDGTYVHIIIHLNILTKNNSLVHGIVRSECLYSTTNSRCKPMTKINILCSSDNKRITD